MMPPRRSQRSKMKEKRSFIEYLGQMTIEERRVEDQLKKNKIVPVGQAKAGDIVFFQFDDDAQPDHVGIVTSNDGKGTLRTIEGNTSEGKGSQSNGDGVYAKKRAYSLVMGVARP